MDSVDIKDPPRRLGAAEIDHRAAFVQRHSSDGSDFANRTQTFRPSLQEAGQLRMHSTTFRDRAYESNPMPCAPVRSLLTAILASIVVLSPTAGFCAEKRKPVSAEEVAGLKRENEKLRADNQRLRKDLAETIPKLQPIDEPSAKAKLSKKSD